VDRAPRTPRRVVSEARRAVRSAESGAKIIRSHLRGPVVVGAGAIIEDSYLGPFTSVANDCHVRNTEVEYSVFLERCHVSDAGRIEGSLLGRDVIIEKSSGKPTATRLMLGDHSQVAI
jgi:glucose-1-phosphate thymidylyltransferase